MLPESAGSVKYFTSTALAALPGIRHAFPCRSGAPLESLDRLSNRMKGSFGLNCLLLAKQAHGSDALCYDGDSSDVEAYRAKPFDAIITSKPEVALGVRTADCLPVLIAAPGRAVAVAHGGWKGIIGGVIEETVRRMIEVSGGDPGEMAAAIGPHVLATCYEVGPEVAEPFRERFGDAVLKPGIGDRALLDLESAARLALESAGMRPQNIDCVRLCTHCRAEWFYSYRRDGRPTGRQISFIVMG